MCITIHLLVACTESTDNVFTCHVFPKIRLGCAIFRKLCNHSFYYENLIQAMYCKCVHTLQAYLHLAK